MFDKNSLFPLVLRGATKQNATEITCLFIFFILFPFYEEGGRPGEKI